VPLCPTHPTYDLGSKPGRRSGKTETNRLRCGTACEVVSSGRCLLMLQRWKTLKKEATPSSKMSVNITRLHDSNILICMISGFHGDNYKTRNETILFSGKPNCLSFIFKSRESSVGNATGYAWTARNWGSTPGRRPTQSPIPWGPGTLPEEKRQERQPDHSRPSSVDITKGGAVTPPTHVFMAWRLSAGKTSPLPLKCKDFPRPEWTLYRR
jgi:hypothetical protein